MLESLLPAPVVCIEGTIDALQGPLLEGEEGCVRGVVPKRRREFVAGRVAARRALARLGIESQALISGPDRCPRWPRGIVGSITHSRDYCAAAAVRAGEIRALGLDLEPQEPLQAELWELVLNPFELRELRTRPERTRGRRAKLIFSVKECAYKCQYPLFGERWEFEDLEVSIEDDERFFVRVRHTPRTTRLAGSRLEGRYRIAGPRLVTAMFLGERLEL